MKFRLLDLFALTAMVAISAALFRLDLIAFRQWLALVLILMGAVTAIAIRYSVSRRTRFWGAVGGLLGSGLFVFATYWFRQAVYDLPSAIYLLEQPKWTADLSTDSWLYHAALLPLVGLILGAALGPILLIALKGIPLPASCRLPFQVSLTLVAAMVLCLFFEMLDRLSLGMGGRNWMPIRWLITMVLVVHSFIWLRRLESILVPPANRVTEFTNSHPERQVS